MSEFKGTKGRWEVDNDGVYSSDPKVLDNIVCLQPEPEFDSSKNWKYNARLISKAPELLEVLKGLVTDVDNLLGQHDIEWQQAGYFNEAKQLIKEATTI